MPFILSPVTVALSCAVAILVAKIFKNRGRLPLPPGPRGFPFIGNALQLPTGHEWFTYTDWGKVFGSVVHVSAFGQPIIILNSITAINDLFEKRGGIYSDRPYLPMASELVGYGDSVPLCQYGPKHREYRKLIHNGLSLNKVENMSHIQEENMRDFLHNLLISPNDLSLHIRNVVAAIVFKASHGYIVSGHGDPLVRLAEQATLEFSLAASPGAFLVDVLPILRYIPDWFPGASFKKTAKKWRQTGVRLKNEPYEEVKKQLARGVALPSFTSNLIETHPNAKPEEEEVFKWVSTAFYSGGADTTVSAISSFFLAMVLYPDVQQKAREEVDRVVGRHRLPTYQDRKDLPYIEALMKEVLRWNPVAPLALPHRSTLDDVYEGYFIPAGSIVIANTWGIFRNPQLHPSPEAFKPERYLSYNSIVPDPRSFAFGYGRRVCPGQYLADASLYLMIVTTLFLFEITNAIDKKTGVPIIPVPNYKSGMICHPEEFECMIKPRFSEAFTTALLEK